MLLSRKLTAPDRVPRSPLRARHGRPLTADRHAVIRAAVIRGAVVRGAVGLALAAGAVAVVGGTSSATVALAGRCGGADRGRLLSTTPIGRLSPAQVTADLTAAGLPGKARYGVDEYRVIYCTISPWRHPTFASGLLDLPHGLYGERPLVVYDHSTLAAKEDAPSFHAVGDGQVVPPYFASDGFAVVAPDYLGLGASPGPHPFMQAASEVSATLDMLPAADRAAAVLRVRLSHDVLLSGHSQGGHAAMAVGQALQREGGRWRLRALAPMAGPYDLGGAELPAILDPKRVDPHRAAAYLAYLMIEWNKLYHLYSDTAQVFTQPYAGTINALFDGTHEFGDIAAALPAPQQLFQPAFLRSIEHPTGRLAAALRANDVCHWAPRVPARLYAGHADRDVVFANAQHCRAQIIARGGNATIADMGNVDHIGTAIAALPLIRAWFTTLAAHGRFGFGN